MRRFNINEFLASLILLLLSVFIMISVKTSHINNLVHPRMNKYLIVAGVIFLVLGIINFKKAFTINYRGRIKLEYIIFVLAITIIIATTNNQNIFNVTNLKNIKFSTQEIAINEGKHIHEINEGKIELNKDNFYCYLSEIEENLEKYIGRKISIEGLVFFGSNNEMVIAKTIMSCCLADSQMLGIRCYYNGEKFKQGQMIKLTGIIDKKIIKSKEKSMIVPYIVVDSMDVKDKEIIEKNYVK